MSVTTPRRVSLPSKPPTPPRPAPKPAAPPKPAPSAPKPAAPADSVKLGKHAQEPEAKTGAADFLKDAYGSGEKPDASEAKDASAASESKDAADGPKEPEQRPFFGSPGQLYSEKHQAEGNDVKEFQDMLGIDQTGKFDKGTTEAVKKFQQDNGLKVDGILGPDTIGKINEMQTPKGAEIPKPPGGAYEAKKDGSIYQALMEKGFTETEIANGKLVEQTKSLNPDMKGDQVKAGTSLQMPIRRERAPKVDAENGVGLQSDNLKPGQSQGSSAKNNELGLENVSEIKKTEDGSSSLTTEAKNSKNPDAGLSETTNVGKDGLINTSSNVKDDSVVTETVAENADGSAGLSSILTNSEDGSKLDVKGLGGENDTKFSSDGKTATIVDPGTKGDDVSKEVSLGENDGPVESAMGKVADFFGFGPEAPAPVELDGLSDISISKDKEGLTTAQATKDGKTSDHVLAPGDTDDTLIEKGGEFIDNAWAKGKDKLFHALDQLLGIGSPKEVEKSAVR